MQKLHLYGVRVLATLPYRNFVLRISSFRVRHPNAQASNIVSLSVQLAIAGRSLGNAPAIYQLAYDTFSFFSFV